MADSLLKPVAGPPVPFHSAPFRYEVREMLGELVLSQLACSKIGLIMHHFTEDLSALLSENLLYLLF